MSDIERYEAKAVAQADAQDRAVARLGEWAQSAQAAHTVAQSLVKTSFVPDQFKGKADEATAAIMTGAEVGLSPLASLRSFDIIQGVAAPRALTLRAILQSMGHEIIVDESTATRCKARGRRRDATEWQTVTWTIDRAKSLGLTGKHNWKAQPQAMLVARATSELARMIAADAILGIGYSVEEISDGAEAGGQVTIEADPAPTGKRTMQRKKSEPESPVEPADPEPVPDPEPEVYEAEVIEEVSDDNITDAQTKKIFAQFGELGISIREDYQQYIQKVVKRDIESSKELTRDEASAVIEAQAADLEVQQ